MAKLTLKPLPGFVLIEPMDDQETTASGLVMPEKAKEKPGKGKIVAIGRAPIEWYEMFPNINQNEVRSIFLNVEEGDRVVFHRWAGQDVKEGQKEYRLVKFADLMGRYE